MKAQKRTTIRKKLARTTTPISLNDEVYEQFLQGLEIITLALTRSFSHIDRDSLFKVYSKKPTRRFTDEYSLLRSGGEAFDCEGRFSLSVLDPDSKEKVLLFVECKYEVHMHGRPKIDKALAERFSKAELRLILLPYARHFISETTAQMSVPPELIPLATTAGIVDK